jgi:hypothetical protein
VEHFSTKVDIPATGRQARGMTYQLQKAFENAQKVLPSQVDQLGE